MIEEVMGKASKAVIIEIMDVFYKMGYEEWNEDITKEEEEEAHLKVIDEEIKKAKKEGYKRFILLCGEEAKEQNLGLNGLSLLVFRR